jgi:NAD(P)-dependent dehydrogenase (short-subunit alcohol dehydrogenase family)
MPGVIEGSRPARRIARGVCIMNDLRHERVVVTGGSRGLGLAMVEAFAGRGAAVTVVARDRRGAAEVERFGAAIRLGDATDAALMDAIVADLRPTVLILNAGATPVTVPLDEQSWESFTAVWDNDVKASLFGIQAALKAPLAPGARVLLASSGAAIVGAPMSGGCAGAKRMLWFMATEANHLAAARNLGIRFQALVPMQMIGKTGLVRAIAGAYARRQGISVDAHLAAKYGAERLTAEQYGAMVAELVADPRYAGGVAWGFKAGAGIVALDAPAGGSVPAAA